MTSKVLSGQGVSQAAFVDELADRVTALHAGGHTAVIYADGAMLAILNRTMHAKLPGVGFVELRFDGALPPWSARVAKEEDDA